jgi:hypothetical protein
MRPLTCRETPVAAQIILRSGLRHFSAGADLDIFDKRAEQGRVDLASESRRLNGVEYLRFMELLPIALIANVHGLQPVWPHLAGEFEFRFPRGLEAWYGGGHDPHIGTT